MRLLTMQIDLDALTKGFVDIEPTVNQMLARLQLAGIPLVDGMAHTLRGDNGQNVGYWSVHPNYETKEEK